MKKIILTSLAAVSVGLGAGFFLGQGPNPSAETAEAEKAPLYWVAPMDPTYRRDGPGKSPMGMDLVPVYEEQESAGYDGLQIDPRIVSNVGVQTVAVTRETLVPKTETVGRIIFDEKATAHVHVRAKGWIETLHVRAEGEDVEKGDPLFDVYSPELVTAQSEFLQARESGRAPLMAAARERLVGLGLDNATIRDIERQKKPLQRITVRAPISGTVTMLNVSDAAHINPGKPALQITNLDSVWLIADIFENDMPRVRKGAKAAANIMANASTLYESVVDHIYPDLNLNTRTNPVRIVLSNHDRALRAGMYMRVRIDGPSLEDVLTIPAVAVIRLGDSDQVMLDEGDGKFRPARVRLGAKVGTQIQVLEGLNEGERVVNAGQFMLDAESSFQGARLRIGGPAGEDEPETISGFTTGTIDEVFMEERRATISHEAIEAFDMMGMTMTFDLSEDVDVSALEAGQSVHFELTRTPEGRFLVTTVHVMDMKMGGHE